MRESAYPFLRSVSIAANRQIKPAFLTILIVPLVLIFCSRSDSGLREMNAHLEKAKKYAFSRKNIFSSLARLEHVDSLLSNKSISQGEKIEHQCRKATILLELGRENEAIELLKTLNSEDPGLKTKILRTLGIAYLRLGERTNCINNHAAESCILPFNGIGFHRDTTGSQQAINIYKTMLAINPDDLESRWLLNIAYMTLDQYPKGIPEKYLIPGMEGDTVEKIAPFIDIAANLGLDLNTMAGGSIADDFDNDGYLDLMISTMYIDGQLRYFRNNGDGSFTDLSQRSGIKDIAGGLNMVQADFNNDGFKDFFVLRGGWQKSFGDEPNSLIRNNGDGTFSDITIPSGLLSFHPTQTATWNDFDNDGFLDLFIGNESEGFNVHSSELYLNNGDETFREVAALSKCDLRLYVKGVTSGDYDNDGWVDIFASTMSGQRVLLKNKGKVNGQLHFEDVTRSAGLSEQKNNTFPTWFWDYDNDGWLDIFACDYTSDKSLGVYAASEKLGIEAGMPDKMLLYHNNKNGTFSNVANQSGLTTNVFAMGSNFGDINNDGFLDMYLGTGNPSYQSLVPNKMFLNKEGKTFAEVTAAARVGHLQKGHGVSFADLDNDGDQDIYIKMGGAYPGDAYQSALFMNPGQGNNNWITLDLVGSNANKSAIGSRIILYITENGLKRQIVRDVNSGGSFGASPLRREIGLGNAVKVDKLEIQWRGSKGAQTINNLSANHFYKITEGDDAAEVLPQKKIVWNLPELLCAPDYSISGTK